MPVDWQHITVQRSSIKLLPEHLILPCFLTYLSGIRVVQCCQITCLFVFSSVLWCPLRFPCKNNVDETVLLAENHHLQQVTDKLSHNVVSSTPCLVFNRGDSSLEYLNWVTQNNGLWQPVPVRYHTREFVLVLFV